MENTPVIGYNGGVLRRLYTKTTRALDDFFQTDTDYLIQSGGWGMFATAITSVLLFVLSLLYARVLTKDLYGTYRYIMSIISIGGFLLLPGVHTAFLRLAAQGKEAVYRADVRWRFIASGLLALFGIGAGVYFLWLQNDAVIGISLMLSGLLVPLERGTGSFIDWFILKKKFRTKAISRIVEYGLFFVLMLGALLYIRAYAPGALESIVLMIAAFYLGHGIPKALYLWRTWGDIPKNGDRSEEKETLKYGFQLSLNSIIPIIANNIDKILVASLLGPVSLAIYSFATVLPDQIRGFITSMDSAASTKIFGKKSKDLEHLPKKFLKASFVMLAIVIVYILLAPTMYEIFFPRYTESVLFSQIYAIGLVCLAFVYLGSALVAKKQLKRIVAHRTSTSLVQILLLVALIPPFGIMGAVISRVIGRFIDAAILYGLFIFKR